MKGHTVNMGNIHGTDMIDLHIHSYYSDGTMSPRELVKEAKKAGLRAISLTDHDTTEGLDEFMDSGREYGIETIPGIELSVTSVGETHILGYCMDYRQAEFEDVIKRLKKTRMENNVRTQDALKAIGIDVTVEEAGKKSPAGSIGRAHFASVMVDKGYAHTVKEAFDKYLRKGGPAYNSLKLLTPEEALGAIKKAGGKAYLAHLHLTNMKGKELEEYIIRLKKWGLDGIEGYYTEYTPEMQEEYRLLAEKYDLKISGGSDFHGGNRRGVEMGYGYGDLKIPYTLVEDMRN